MSTLVVLTVRDVLPTLGEAYVQHGSVRRLSGVVLWVMTGRDE